MNKLENGDDTAEGDLNAIGAVSLNNDLRVDGEDVDSCSIDIEVKLPQRVEVGAENVERISVTSQEHDGGSMERRERLFGKMKK